MTCEECVFWISQQPVGPETARRCDEHMRECESCRQFLAYYNERMSPTTGYPYSAESN